MATILEEAYRLNPNTDAIVRALVMPSGSPLSGAEAYTPIGDPGVRLIRPQSAQGVAEAAARIAEAGAAYAAANPYVGRIFGSSVDSAQNKVLQKRQQDLDFAIRRAQLAEQARQANMSASAAAEERNLRRQANQIGFNARQQNDILDFVAAMSGVDARNYATDSRFGGGGTAAPVARAFSGGGVPGTAGTRTVRASANRVDPMATTVADRLYDTLTNIRDEQADLEAPAMREITDAVASVVGKYGVAPTYDENGIPSFGEDKEQEAFLNYLDWSSPWGEEGPTSTIGQTLARIQAGRQDAVVRAAGVKDAIAAAKASKRLELPLPAERGPVLSPLAQLLLQMPATVTPEGRLSYTPAQTAEALTKLGWRGAYGGAAFGSNPAEQARAEAARRLRTMTPSVMPVAEPAPARIGFGDLRVSEAAPGVNRNLNAVPVNRGDGRATLLGMIANLFAGSATPGPAVSPGTAYSGMGVLPRGGVAPSVYPQGAGSVADFTDPSLPPPTAVERLLTSLYPAPTPVGGGSVDVLAGLRDALLAGYPAPAPIGGGTFDMATAVPAYGAPTPYANSIRDAVVAGYPTPAPVQGTYDMNASAAAIANLIRAAFGRVQQAGRNVLEYGYPTPAPINGTFNLESAVPQYRR